MSANRITRQLDALQAIDAEGGEVSLLGTTFSHANPCAQNRPIDLRVWERLIYRDDLEILVPSGTSPSVKGLRLRLTEQGRTRIAEEADDDH